MTFKSILNCLSHKLDTRGGGGGEAGSLFINPPIDTLVTGMVSPTSLARCGEVLSDQTESYNQIVSLISKEVRVF